MNEGAAVCFGTECAPGVTPSDINVNIGLHEAPLVDVPTGRQDNKQRNQPPSSENWACEPPGEAADGHDIDVSMDHRSERRKEARQLSEMVAQFYEAAGSTSAAYEEVPTTLRYETRVNDSGEVEEKLVGIAFTPEPFIKTMRQVARLLLFQLATALVFAIAWALFCVGVWQTCEDKSVTLPWILIDFLRRLLTLAGYIALLFLMAEGDMGQALHRFRTGE
ncbi:unnamed protein product [Vitrella brassicaformis CCMP3155]|uniref:Transmembrane protein n=1 Tax=Vitrella brassicaformis (strain CCMP3155) TaxID=1169540 RepID=A0A0G4GTQ8_VITBC|nr:unnamed protein product [Vitrella brassicaformis CCMP3155]|eukprot:CEM34157.1 unnamed protein product [Vitrella brassicaformis CCMP3155]